MTYHEVFVGSDERYITKLRLKVDTKGLNTVAHRVCGHDSWQMLKNILAQWDRLFEVFLIIRTVIIMTHLGVMRLRDEHVFSVHLLLLRGGGLGRL